MGMGDPHLFSPGDLPARWRGRPQRHRLWHLAVAELDQALRTIDHETFSLVEAARVSGAGYRWQVLRDSHVRRPVLAGGGPNLRLRSGWPAWAATTHGWRPSCRTTGAPRR